MQCLLMKFGIDMWVFAAVVLRECYFFIPTISQSVTCLMQSVLGQVAELVTELSKLCLPE